MEISNRERIKIRKNNLIKSGLYESFKYEKKAQWETIKNNDCEFIEPSKDYRAYGLQDEEALELCNRIEKSTKKKKTYARRMLNLMVQGYPFVYMVELGYSNRSRETMSYETMKRMFTRALKHYPHYFGKVELSENGKLHFHGFIATFEELEPIGQRKRKGHTSILYKDPILQAFWYGETEIDENGVKQPSNYGIYDIVGLNTDANDTNNKASNYVLKNLNTMASYISKDANSFSFNPFLDEDLLLKVNTSNLIVKRNSPICRYIREYDEAIKDVKAKCRVFDNTFYSKNKFGYKKNFEEWYYKHKDYEPYNVEGLTLDVKPFEDGYYFPNLKQMIQEQKEQRA